MRIHCFSGKHNEEISEKNISKSSDGVYCWHMDNWEGVSQGDL